MMAETVPTETEIVERKGALLGLFDRMLPIVDGIADSFRFATLLGLALVIWVCVWMLYFGGFELTTALLVAVIIILPILVLLRFWLGLEDLKKLPQTVESLVSDARGEVRERVAGIRASEQKLGLISSAGKLWQLRSLADEARQLLGSYVNIGSLVNPVSLVLGFLSLLFIPGLALAGLALAVLALF
jgi:ABC-type multidrug transport system fused ATPase/permease subunit